MSPSLRLFKEVSLSGEQPMQYVGNHVLRYRQDWKPSIGFAELGQDELEGLLPEFAELRTEVECAWLHMNEFAPRLVFKEGMRFSDALKHLLDTVEQLIPEPELLERMLETSLTPDDAIEEVQGAQFEKDEKAVKKLAKSIRNWRPDGRESAT